MKPSTILLLYINSTYKKNGRKSKKEEIYVYIHIHFATMQKLTHIVKQLYSNKN